MGKVLPTNEYEGIQQNLEEVTKINQSINLTADPVSADIYDYNDTMIIRPTTANWQSSSGDISDHIDFNIPGSRDMWIDPKCLHQLSVRFKDEAAKYRDKPATRQDVQVIPKQNIGINMFKRMNVFMTGVEMYSHTIDYIGSYIHMLMYVPKNEEDYFKRTMDFGLGEMDGALGTTADDWLATTRLGKDLT